MLNGRSELRADLLEKAISLTMLLGKVSVTLNGILILF